MEEEILEINYRLPRRTKPVQIDLNYCLPRRTKPVQIDLREFKPKQGRFKELLEEGTIYYNTTVTVETTAPTSIWHSNKVDS